MITICLVVLVYTAGCGPTEEEQTQLEQRQTQLQEQQTSDLPYNFRMEMDSVLTRYFALKNALVESDSELSKEKAAELSAFTREVMDDVLEAENQGLWLGIAQIIQNETDNLIAEDEIDEQRIYFENISIAMIRIAESFNPVSYTIYHQSCPMFHSGSADWLSREEEIRNPYHGDRMMTCGEIIQRI